MRPATCPDCGSLNTRNITYLDVDCIVCNECGFDEREELDTYPQDRTNQKAKASYSPYRSGGKGRTRQR